MRHRRRIYTQTIRKKTDAQTSTRYISPKRTVSKKPLAIILSIVVIALVVFLYGGQIREMVSSGYKKSFAEKPKASIAEQEPSIPVETKDQGVLYYSPIEKKIQLEILNGCGEPGVAKKLTELLRKSTYDIVNSGNYMEKGKINWEVQETRIIDQVGNTDISRDLADEMGILYSNLEVFDNPSPIADITIIIGKDYKTLPIFK